MTAPIALSAARARALWLRAQRLDRAAPFGAGPAATRDAVAHLGYVQIDTINVIERCHHQILYTRIPDYRRDDLRHAQSVDKSVFEYWTHALSYVPTADLPFYRRAMLREWQQFTRWFTVPPAEVRKVVARVRRDGALTIRDIDDDVLVDKDHAWASRKPSKRALQIAFFQGALTVSARRGMVKTYELAGRHFGWDRPPRAASASAALAFRLDRALRAQGVVSLDSACYLAAALKPAMQRLVAQRVRRGTLVPVAVAGAERAMHWAEPAALAETGEAAAGLVHILSPFDPLVIQRKRLELFFGYAHRFEAYVPAARRVLGYFAQPVLADDAIVAALDLKADRQAGRLLVRKWTWLGRHPRAMKARIEDALHRFERFQLSS